jgi:hypothetical protein
MNTESILSRLFEIINSRNKIYIIIFAIAALITLVSMYKRKKKIKFLMASEKFKDSEFFREGIKSPMAISQDGYIGIVVDVISVPVVINIRDITEFGLVSGKNSIAAGRAEDPGRLLFSGLASIAEQKSMMKHKKLNLILCEKDDLVYNIPLYASSIKTMFFPGNPVPKEILRLLGALEEAEKKIKG